MDTLFIALLCKCILVRFNPLLPPGFLCLEKAPVATVLELCVVAQETADAMVPPFSSSFQDFLTVGTGMTVGMLKPRVVVIDAEEEAESAGHVCGAAVYQGIVRKDHITGMGIHQEFIWMGFSLLIFRNRDRVDMRTWYDT